MKQRERTILIYSFSSPPLPRWHLFSTSLPYYLGFVFFFSFEIDKDGTFLSLAPPEFLFLFGFVPFLHGIFSLDLSSDNVRLFIFFAVLLFRALFLSYFISWLSFQQRLPISFGLPPFFFFLLNSSFSWVRALFQPPSPLLLGFPLSSIYLDCLLNACYLFQ